MMNGELMNPVVLQVSYLTNEAGHGWQIPRYQLSRITKIRQSK